MIIAITNQKGGTGKTTTTINLGGALGEMGRRVLIIDLDPQANATLHCGLMPEEQEDTVWTALQQAGRTEVERLDDGDLRSLLDSLWDTQSFNPSLLPIVKAPNNNPFDLVPCNLELSEVDIVLASAVSRERRLATVLASVQSEYDYVLIDCPPHLGILTLNALTAADAVIIPLETAFFASKGMNQIFRVLLQVKQTLNYRLNVLGVLITRVDRRTTHSIQIATEARRALEKQVNVFETEVPVNVDLVDATAAGLCITLHSPSSRGARAYRQLAEEIESTRDGQEAY
ncbi:MAG: ParA family protein [Anaerolineae bacterium]|nr:ParA family protein [Anaerolineae bacterium]